jgi:hypothetical protein
MPPVPSEKCAVCGRVNVLYAYCDHDTRWHRGEPGEPIIVALVLAALALTPLLLHWVLA